MHGENAFQNANIFRGIWNFGVNFLICDMELAKLHEVHRDVLRKHHLLSQAPKQYALSGEQQQAKVLNHQMASKWLSPSPQIHQFYYSEKWEMLI